MRTATTEMPTPQRPKRIQKKNALKPLTLSPLHSRRGSTRVDIAVENTLLASRGEVRERPPARHAFGRD